MNLIYKCIPRYIATLGYYQKKYSLGQREGYNKGVLYLISVLSMTHRYIISLHGHYVI